MIESSAHLLKPPTQLERPLPPKNKRPLYFYFCLFCLQSQRSHCPWPPRQYPLFYNTFENDNHRVGFLPSSHCTCSDFPHSVHLSELSSPRAHTHLRCHAFSLTTCYCGGATSSLLKLHFLCYGGQSVAERLCGAQERRDV